MAQFVVTVCFTERKTRDVTVYARDEQEAQERAVARVEEWENVIEAEAVDVREK